MDCILKNGKILTMDGLGTIAQAVGIRDGKIVAIGTNEEILSMREKNTSIIDVNNKLVLPGFIDSHMHMLNYGYVSGQISLGQCKSINNIIEAGKKYILENEVQESKWVLGRGWNQDYFIDKRYPTREDLDKISLKHPICVTRACGHIAVANSLAVKIIKEKTSNYKNENIDWDLGLFKEDGLDILYSNVDAPTIQEIKNMLAKAAKDLVKSGITSVQTDDFNAMPDRDYKKVIKAYKELIAEGQLPVRVYEQCLLPSKELFKEFLDLGYRTGDGDERFKIGPLKLLADGSLGARTALLCDGYNDQPSTYGISSYSQKELNDMVLLANKNRMQVAIHAIGDKAMYMALDAIKNANEEYKRIDARHGIVHCQITNEEIINRFKDEDILAYVQPIFINYDLHIIEARVGIEKSKKTYNWKSMIEKGIKVSGGSDCPVEDFNVLENIYSAVTRKDLDGYPENGWLSKEKLTIDEAVKLFTVNGAYASFEDNIKGTIEIGKLADMVILSQDIFEIEEDKIKDVGVVLTIVNGQIVYKA